MMKKWIWKMMLTTLSIAVLLAVAAAWAWAVPAKPGTGYTGADAACRSHAGALVTLDEIPARRGKAAKRPVLTRPPNKAKNRSFHGRKRTEHKRTAP